MTASAAPLDRRPANFFQVSLWTALYALPLLLALSPHIDADLWWHLRTGQWIVQEGQVPATDPFSLFGQESRKPWVAYSWLFEITAYGFFTAFGLRGIILLRVLLLLAVLAAIHRLVGRREPQFVRAAVIVAAAFVALIPLSTERPWLFSILGCALTLDVVLDLREGRSSRSVWLLPILFVLWANIHVQFVYGLLILGLACLAPVIDRGWQRSETRTADAGCYRRLWALTALCFAATFVNPYGARVHEVVLDYALHPAGHRQITELQALDFRGLWDWCVLGFFGAALFALGRGGSGSSYEGLLLIAGAWFGFRTKRDLWFMVLAGTTVLVTVRPTGTTGVRGSLPTIRQATVMAAALFLLVGLYWRAQLNDERMDEVLRREYPVEAVAQVRERLANGSCRGPLYNHFDWGGFLIWNLPELPVALDGRSNLHGDDRVERMAATWQGLPGWDHDPELAKAGVVIVNARTGLASLLRGDPRFALVHEDPVALVFVRR